MCEPLSLKIQFSVNQKKKEIEDFASSLVIYGAELKHLTPEEEPEFKMTGEVLIF